MLAVRWLSKRTAIVGALALLAAAGLLTTARRPPPAATGVDAPPRAPTTSGVASSVRREASPQPVSVDANTRVPIPLADRVPARLPTSGVPAGWDLREFTGRALVELVRDGGRLAVRLRSERSSFALYRDIVVDIKEYPILTWSWKVTRLPLGADGRDRARDDQAAQIYVIFPRWPSPRTSSDVIGYVWDTRAPVGARFVSPKARNVRIIVVDSGAGALDRWETRQRNVLADYASLFAGPPPQAGKIALMIDSNDTRGEAEALIADLDFSRPAR